MQTTRISSSDRRVLRRESTTYSGEQPTNGFPSVAMGELGGGQFEWFGVFDLWSGILEGGNAGLLGERDPFLASRWGL